MLANVSLLSLNQPAFTPAWVNQMSCQTNYYAAFTIVYFFENNA